MAVTAKKITKLRPITNKALKELKGRTFKVLDDGFVRLVDHMGSDCRIVEAARLTAQSDEKLPGDDRKLLRYLFRHYHTTPFEFCNVTFHVRCPIDCFRQWVRHRTFSINEYSTRYSPAIDSKAKAQGRWRQQSKSNRQGSSEGLVFNIPDEQLENTVMDLHGVGLDAWCSGLLGTTPGTAPEESGLAAKILDKREAQLHEMVEAVYAERLALGVALEQARKDLTLSTYTEVYWTGNLHNLLHFLRLRMDPHAQLEIRSYANVIGEEIVSQLFPATWEAFLDYRHNARQFSSIELEYLGDMLTCLLSGVAVTPLKKDEFGTVRETAEFFDKLRDAGVHESLLQKLRKE